MELTNRSKIDGKKVANMVKVVADNEKYAIIGISEDGELLGVKMYDDITDNKVSLYAIFNRTGGDNDFTAEKIYTLGAPHLVLVD